MTYLERLNPWCIIRPFPNMRSLIVGRFRRRVDAFMSSASSQANDAKRSF